MRPSGKSDIVYLSLNQLKQVSSLMISLSRIILVLVWIQAQLEVLQSDATKNCSTYDKCIVVSIEHGPCTIILAAEKCIYN
jgi:hypothetical protein